MPTYIIPILCVALAAAYVVSSPRARGQATAPASQPAIAVATPGAEEADLLERALRGVLRRVEGDTAYVSLGSEGTGWRDPPPAFLRRLDDLRLTLRPISAARIPTATESTRPPPGRGFEDPPTGDRVTVCYAVVTARPSGTRAHVTAGLGSHPRSFANAVAVYERRDGRWRLTSSHSEVE